MKTSVLITALCCVLQAGICHAQKKTNPVIDGPVTERYIDPNDPAEQTNIDPNWDWTPIVAGHTMYYSTDASTPVPIYPQLPFYSSHPLSDAINNDSKDMWQQDGWILVYKDFGTATSAPPNPFFALYNKYKGVLRIMVYNAPANLSSACKMTLSFRNSSPRPPIFTYTESKAGLQYTSSYDPNATQVVMATTPQGQGWICGDFLLAYAPNLDRNTILHLSIDVLDISQTSSNGTLTLNEVLASNPGGNEFTGSDLKSSLNQGYKVYGSVETAAKDLSKPTAGLKSILGIFSAFTDVVSLVEYLISGGDNPVGREPMKFTGTTTLDGTITTGRHVVDYDFALFRGGQNLPEIYQPVQLQDIPWGVVSLTRLTGDEVVTSQTYYCADKGIDVTDYTSTTNFVNEYNVNDESRIGARLVSAEYRPLLPALASGFSPISWLPNEIASFSGSDNCYGTYNSGGITSIGIKFNFEILSPTKNYNRFYSIYKVYNFFNNGARKGIVEVAEGSKVYPNPFTDRVKLTLPNEVNDATRLQIFDISGRSILSQPITDAEKKSGYIEWNGKGATGNDSAPGTYIFKLDSQNKPASTFKVLKL